MRKKRKLTNTEFEKAILAGDRVILSQAITLMESARPDDAIQAEDLLQRLLPKTGNSIRLGITGVPGVGKSTFIEAFGTHITSKGKKLAVLTIDPSSQRTKGSILGDKTRMEELSRNPNAYVRPSASGSTLGGVGHKTREVMLLCEAAGYDVIFIETVGVGQSETMVHGMVDFFLLLMLAGAGDELQGIKKGIMELADAVVINKADGENVKASKRARVEYQNALHLFPMAPSGWLPEVKTCSSLENSGLEEIWEMVLRHHEKMTGNGFREKLRKEQQLSWMEEHIHTLLLHSFHQHPEVKNKLGEICKLVESGDVPALKAARELIEAFAQK